MLAIPSTPTSGGRKGVRSDAMLLLFICFICFHSYYCWCGTVRLTSILGLPGSVPEEPDSDTEGSVLP